MSDALVVQPNAFQRLMLQWERLAPYNAGQYATIAADFDDEHARLAWRDVSITLGLQQIGQSPDAAVRVTSDPVESFVTAELNRSFGDSDAPLRPFMLRGGSTPHVGIMYRHVVADSASIRLLIRAWVERLLMLPPRRETHRHIRLMRDDGLRMFDARRRWGLIRESVGELSRLSRMKQVRRLPAEATPGSPVVWRRIELPSEMIHRLLTAARRARARVNDLFVAAAAIACDEFLPHEDSDARRDLGIGTVVDLRAADQPAADHFGVSLGFLQTVWRRQDLRRWDRVLAVAATQARIARERRLAEASILRLAVATRHGQSLTDAQLATFYRKRCPLAAGISNVNLNRDWPAALHPSPLAAYTRISPLGPMLPLVFTPTTLGDSLHLGVTYRTSAIDAATADAIIAAFIAALDRAAR